MSSSTKGARVASPDAMTARASSTVDAGAPKPPRVSGCARTRGPPVAPRRRGAAEALGIALLRSTDCGGHVMTSETYERLLGSRSTLGRPVDETLPESIASRAMPEPVVADGKAARGHVLGMLSSTTVRDPRSRRTSPINARRSSSALPAWPGAVRRKVPARTPDRDASLQGRRRRGRPRSVGAPSRSRWSSRARARRPYSIPT